MPHFLQPGAYSREGWEALVANPQNRIEAVRPAIENWEARLKPRGFLLETTTCDHLDLPDNVRVAAIAMAFAAGGACKSVETVPLISPEEATQALRKARECGYRPATLTTRAA